MFSMYARTTVHAMITPGNGLNSPCLFLERDDGCWELPKSHLLPGESRLDALTRMLKTKTGLLIPREHVADPINYPVILSPEYFLFGDRHDFFPVAAKAHEVSFESDTRHIWRTPQEAIAKLVIQHELVAALRHVVAPV